MSGIEALQNVRCPLEAIKSVRMILCFVFSGTEKGG
jgi:hypothetical protein